jgi:glycerol-3-phosphate cytidylyltransferase
MKTGFVASCFDLLHAGHCLMLKDACFQCDHLIVALQTDPTIDRPKKNKPIQSFPERIIQLEAIRYIDEIVVYNTEKELLEWLKILKPDVRILGSDYKDKDFTGSDLEMEVYYHERSHDWSTSALRKKIVDEN